MKTLAVTSPLTRNESVRAAQERLNGRNFLKQDFLQGPVSGEFDLVTARACRRAKFWLGYPGATVNSDRSGPIYGDYLDKLLSGARALPPAYAKRRAARLAAAKQKPLRVKALERAKTKVGIRESPPSSNVVEFSRWYGLVGPWCAMFVTWAYAGAGSKALARGARYAYVPFVVNDARAGRNGLAVTADPQPGDLVCFDWDGGVADHIGLFQRWLDRAKGTFLTVEGNTSATDVGSQSNGGMVAERIRERRQVECFVRVGK